MRFFGLARGCIAATAFSLIAQDATAVTTYASIYGYNQGVQYNWYNNDVMYDSSGTYVNASGETGWGTMGARVNPGAGTIETNAYGLIFRDYCVAGGATCDTGGGGMIAMVDTFTLSGVGDITFFMDITGTSHGYEPANTSAASMSMYAPDAVSPGRGPMVRSGERKAAPELGPNAFKYDRLELHLNVIPEDAFGPPYTFNMRWMQRVDAFVSTDMPGDLSGASLSMKSQLGVEVTSGVTITSASGVFPITRLAPVPADPVAPVPLPASGAALLAALGLLGWARRRRT